MERAAPSVVGILAGGGTLPREIADAMAAGGAGIVVVGLEGEAEPELFAGFDFTLLRWGEIGRLVRAFKSKGARDLVIVGSVSRPDMRRLKTDLGFWLNLPRILRIMAAGGDDHVLRRVVRFFESHGFRVVGPADVAPSLVIGSGVLGRQAMPEVARRDAEFGRTIVAALAPFDVGQAVVVATGEVLAIEGAEGTDAMLARVAALRRKPERGGVLVKWPKPGQELRVDMPAIGPGTIAGVVAAGLDGIAVQAHATLAAQRHAMIEAADGQAVFIAGLRPSAEPAVKTALTDDGGIGLAVLRALAPAVRSRGVAVVRRHVLAVETGEGLAALVARAAGLRQWGSRGRRGALAVAALSEVDQALVSACVDAGYERIVTATGGSVANGLAREARAAGLSIDVRGSDT